jgi:hypothetical protein
MAEPTVRQSVASLHAGRPRLERIRRLRSQLDAKWGEVTPVARQAAALELARDQEPWLLEQLALVRVHYSPAPRSGRRGARC